MGIKVTYNAVNQVEKGTVIYAANELIESVCIIVKGRVLAVNEGSKIILGSGSFLGISDLYAEHYLSTYIAYDDLMFYCFPMSKKEEIFKIFATNADYRGLMIASLVKNLNDMEKIYSSMEANAEQLYEFIHRNNEKYLELGRRTGYPTKIINDIQDMLPYSNEVTIEEKRLAYYKECLKVPLEAWKQFCAAGDTITLYLVEEISDLLAQVSQECIGIASYISEIFDNLINNTELCLFKNIAALAITIEEAGGYSNELTQMLDNIIDEINIIENLFEEKVGRNLSIDRDLMEEIYYVLLSKNSNRSEMVQDGFKYTQQEMQQALTELNDATKQISKYAQFEEEKAANLERFILTYLNLRDKHSADDNVRVLRKALNNLFYELYEKVFFRAYQDKTIPRVIDLFLKYGFLDERLLNKEQLRELYYLEDEKQDQTGPCQIYNIKEWLFNVYSGKKEPSKNEFDLDYKDMLRDRRKRAQITEAEEKELQQDLKQKVIYEIHNMFRYNHRVVSGQISTFVPFLCGESMLQDINKLWVSASRVNSAIKELLEIDYSIFHREVLYVNNEKGIAKEYIEKQVFPDIILMPTVGLNGVMWQEITEKRKSKEGRFILPAITDRSVKELLIRVFGRFRWELCRTIQGSAWNNIKYKSLTSEYSDYIQFYRKNRDLSEEVKEKVKTQIQKGKSNYREIFVIDYEAWMKGESSGGIRLNKVARELLATYCPFSKSLRKKLEGQPLFSDAMARFTRNNIKKAKELELRYRGLEKDNIELTEELMETLMFYRDL